jgi:hypothetical protein
MAFILTLMASMILYVRGQVEIFRVSYAIDSKMDSLVAKSDEYRRLKFEVDQMKAPRLLEARMKERKLDLSLPKEVHVVSLPPVPQVNRTVFAADASHPFSNGVGDFFGRWVKVAQAKSDR